MKEKKKQAKGMIIGITGGIGTGKTTVAEYLAEKGYLVISADKVAREIVEPGSPALEDLAREFGNEIIREDGSLDRQKLAALAFADKYKKKRLDELTHGRIIEIMMERARAYINFQAYHFPDEKTPIVFMEVPLLFESGMDKMVDKIWVIDAPMDVRMSRIRLRDGLTMEDIKKRLEYQLDSMERRKMADLILENDGDKEDLYMSVDYALNKYLNAG